MNVFGTIDRNDYTIEISDIGTPLSWQLVSSSVGTQVEDIPELSTAVQIFRADDIPSPDDRIIFTYSVSDTLDGQFTRNSPAAQVVYTPPEVSSFPQEISEYLLFRSIKHMFYTNGVFTSGSAITNVSPAPLSEKSFVVSIGQSLFGDRIKPGSFELELSGFAQHITDDGAGNLLVSQSYVGNIFYDYGIAVIRHDIDSLTPNLSGAGLKLLSGSRVFIDYESQVRTYRYQINARLAPSQFNYSMFNPSMRRIYETTNPEFVASMATKNVPSSGSLLWKLYDLMGAAVITPYVTSIGLYNDKHELLAVAKMSTPVQRTSNVDQVFIIRFDV